MIDYSILKYIYIILLNKVFNFFKLYFSLKKIKIKKEKSSSYFSKEENFYLKNINSNYIIISISNFVSLHAHTHTHILYMINKCIKVRHERVVDWMSVCLLVDIYILLYNNIAICTLSLHIVCVCMMRCLSSYTNLNAIFQKYKLLIFSYFFYSKNGLFKKFFFSYFHDL